MHANKLILDFSKDFDPVESVWRVLVKLWDSSFLSTAQIRTAHSFPPMQLSGAT